MFAKIKSPSAGHKHLFGASSSLLIGESRAASFYPFILGRSKTILDVFLWQTDGETAFSGASVFSRDPSSIMRFVFAFLERVVE